MSHALTIKYGQPVSILIAKIGIGNFLVPRDEQVQMQECNGIWDTGASNSAISKRLIENLGLMPTRLVNVYHAGGKSEVRVYQISLALENNILFPDIEVTEADLLDDHLPEHEQFDVLIGMDIIGAGDFAITNFKEKTTLTFRVPSKEEIDFTKNR